MTSVTEIVRNIVIIPLSGLLGAGLIVLIRKYFGDLGGAIKKQEKLLDDMRSGNVKVMYQQPDACIRFMGRFEEELDKNELRLSKVEALALFNSGEIRDIRKNLKDHKKSQTKIIEKLNTMGDKVSGIIDSLNTEALNREVLTTSNLNMVTAFHKGREAIEDIGSKLLEKLDKMSKD